MKTLLLVLTFALAGMGNLNAQTSFSCSYRQYCNWNDETKKFEKCEGYEENSLFVVNKDQTMFTHTIESMKSAYYVNSKEYNKEKNLWIYDVISDVGNKYKYFFDPNNKEVRGLYERNGKTLLVVFTVKAIF